eukprot:CAMPEP_0184560450 /NCGR_PEP_ID=MMETSP0199_2-20130426/46941_1 /TAXON_ID=1112570 /ORGANISM="Thraustochytrium sp., Strain LLF1b" /LENGTH=215 /DNA_ID=CAMNT_0026957751 /DNA_START=47 /DNA_END=694 /DNA_ORIENTATION=-
MVKFSKLATCALVVGSCLVWVKADANALKQVEAVQVNQVLKGTASLRKRRQLHLKKLQRLARKLDDEDDDDTDDDSDDYSSLTNDENSDDDTNEDTEDENEVETDDDNNDDTDDENEGETDDDNNDDTDDETDDEIENIGAGNSQSSGRGNLNNGGSGGAIAGAVFASGLLFAGAGYAYTKKSRGSNSDVALAVPQDGPDDAKSLETATEVNSSV